MDPGVRKRVTAVQPTADVVSLRFSGPELHYLKLKKKIASILGWDSILGLSTHCRIFSIIGLCPVNAGSSVQILWKPSTPPIHTLPDVPQMERK